MEVVHVLIELLGALHWWMGAVVVGTLPVGNMFVKKDKMAIKLSVSLERAVAVISKAPVKRSKDFAFLLAKYLIHFTYMKGNLLWLLRRCMSNCSLLERYSLQS